MIGDGGITFWYRFAAVTGMLYGAGGDYQMAGVDMGLQAAAATNADKPAATGSYQLFESDGRSGSANAVGTDSNGRVSIGTLINSIFPLVAEQLRMFQVRGNFRSATGIATNEHIWADATDRQPGDR